MQERFATAYRAAGSTVDLEVFPDAPHMFALSPGKFPCHIGRVSFVIVMSKRGKGV